DRRHRRTRAVGQSRGPRANEGGLGPPRPDGRRSRCRRSAAPGDRRRELARLLVGLPARSVRRRGPRPYLSARLRGRRAAPRRRGCDGAVPGAPGSSGTGWDVGLVYDLTPMLTVGAVVANLGRPVARDSVLRVSYTDRKSVV